MERDTRDGPEPTLRALAAISQAPIGADSDAIRNQLFSVADRMEGLLDGAARELVRDAKHVLRAMVCRIAIIGQVKAGKSSLINALIRQPQLLPSDVNPWTTAVTRLHFNQANAQRDVAAEFRFFDAHEWDELADGGGLIRELTERLVPGFEATALGRHLQAMRDRAADRLGPEFVELLGRSHTFRTFDQRTLEAYVCAGTTSMREPGDSSVGRYSNITKSAHLYLNGTTFGFPTTLVDTPGTNDPWLVRDEITRQSLDSADVYIVVLTARQALSTDDVALLRILRGLRKERVIVFVNRIDELGDFDSELDAVEDQITKGLKREFAGIKVPIVYGSALWANQALESSSDTNPGKRSAALMAFQERLGHSSLEHDLREVLFKCSGIPSLAEVLNSSIRQSHPVQIVRHLATSFSDLADLHQSAAREALTWEQSNSVGGDDARAAVPTEGSVSDMIGALERLRMMSATLEQSIAAFETALVSMAAREMEALGIVLHRAIDDFKHTESQRLSSAIETGKLGFVWQCDTGPLRQRLEAVFVEQFRTTEANILHAEQAILPHLKKVITDVLHSHLAGRKLVLAPAPMHPPSIGMLGRIVALDLDAPWWKAWWTTKHISEERTRELQRVIGHEFLPIAAGLVQSARERVMAQINGTINDARGLCLGIVQQLYRQNEAQIARLGGLGTDLASPREPSRDVPELKERLTSWSEIGVSLNALTRACTGLRRPREPGHD